MAQAKQTVERLQLGLVLARLRDAAGRSQLQAGNAIGRTSGRISQVEHGRGTLAPEELDKLLDYYAVAGQERETVLALAAVGRKRRPRRVYVDLLPQPLQRLTDMLAAASVINWYECGVVPGLAQSADYIRSLAASFTESDQETEERVRFRLEQQARVLEALPAKQIDFVITEDTLYHVVGDPSVMRGQVLHLLQLVENHPLLTIRVVPNTAPNNPALGGGLIMLDFVESNPVAFAPVVLGPSAYYDQPYDLDPMCRILNQVKKLAMSVEHSRAWLIGLL